MTLKPKRLLLLFYFGVGSTFFPFWIKQLLKIIKEGLNKLKEWHFVMLECEGHVIMKYHWGFKKYQDHISGQVHLIVQTYICSKLLQRHFFASDFFVNFIALKWKVLQESFQNFEWYKSLKSHNSMPVFLLIDKHLEFPTYTHILKLYYLIQIPVLNKSFGKICYIKIKKDKSCP